MLEETKKSRANRSNQVRMSLNDQSRKNSRNQYPRTQKSSTGKSKLETSNNSNEEYQSEKYNRENVRNGATSLPRSDIQEGYVRHGGPPRRKHDGKISKSLDWENSFNKYQDFRRSYDNCRLFTNDRSASSNSSSPYAFQVFDEDLKICSETNNSIYDIRKSLYFLPEIDNHLTQIYLSTNHNLNNYASYMINETMNQRQRATDEWLKSKSEDEKSQYLARLKGPLSTRK